METRNQETTKKCEICGRELPISDFSKSYRNRCKACVAEQVREQRKNGKMITSSVDWEQREFETAKALLSRKWAVVMSDSKELMMLMLFNVDMRVNAIKAARNFIEVCKICKKGGQG